MRAIRCKDALFKTFKKDPPSSVRYLVWFRDILTLVHAPADIAASTKLSGSLCRQFWQALSLPQDDKDEQEYKRNRDRFWFVLTKKRRLYIIFTAPWDFFSSRERIKLIRVLKPDSSDVENLSRVEDAFRDAIKQPRAFTGSQGLSLVPCGLETGPNLGVDRIFYFVYSGNKLSSLHLPSSSSSLEQEERACENFGRVLGGYVASSSFWVFFTFKPSLGRIAFVVYVAEAQDKDKDKGKNWKKFLSKKPPVEIRNEIQQFQELLAERFHSAPAATTIASWSLQPALRPSSTSKACSSSFSSSSQGQAVSELLASASDRALYAKRSTEYHDALDKILGFDNMKAIRSKQAKFAIVTACLSQRPGHEDITLRKATAQWLSDRQSFPRNTSKNKKAAVKFLCRVFEVLKRQEGEEKVKECVYSTGSLNFIVSLLVSGTCNCACFTKYALAAAEEAGLDEFVLPDTSNPKHLLCLVVDPGQSIRDPSCDRAGQLFSDPSYAGFPDDLDPHSLLNPDLLAREVHKVVAHVDAATDEKIASVLLDEEQDQDQNEHQEHREQDEKGKKGKKGKEKKGALRTKWTNVELDLQQVAFHRNLTVARAHFELMLVARLAGLDERTFDPMIAIAMTRSLDCVRPAFALQEAILNRALRVSKPQVPCAVLKGIWSQLWNIAAYKPEHAPSVESFSYARALP